jgi:DNA repair and recombination protein RAD54 and RAD54-like protein
MIKFPCVSRMIKPGLAHTATCLALLQLVEVVCCKMTQMQQDVYNHFVKSKGAANMAKTGKGGTKVLAAITALKKLCNHPKLIYDVIHSKQGGASDGFEGCERFFPPGMYHAYPVAGALFVRMYAHKWTCADQLLLCTGVFDDGRPGRGGLAIGWEALSGKFAVVSKMLSILWTQTDDKIVIVSNYTQTLDLLAGLCREQSYPFVRLDGSTTINKRQKMVCASSPVHGIWAGLWQPLTILVLVGSSV